MRQFIGIGAGLIALLFAVGFLTAALAAPFGARAELGGPSFVLELTFLVLGASTFGHLIGQATRWAILGVLLGCSGLVTAGYFYAQQAMLFTWGSFQAFAAIALITLWHATALKSGAEAIEDK